MAVTFSQKKIKHNALGYLPGEGAVQRAPNETDDATKGFEANSTWLYPSAQKKFVCTTADTGSAIWNMYEMDGRVVNKTGGDLLKNKIVYWDGADSVGSVPTVDLAKANAEATSAATAGFLLDTLSDNEKGYVIRKGKVTGVDTSAFALGGYVWLSKDTAGAITHIEPDESDHPVRLGIVTFVHASQGEVDADVINGYEIDELHGVKAKIPKDDKDVMIYDGVGSYYEQRNLLDDDITIQKIGTPTYATLRDMITLMFSAGLTASGTIISDAGGATVNLAAKTAMFRTTDDETGDLKSANIPALNAQSIPTDTVRYIVANYHATDPFYSVETTDTSNGNTIFIIGSVVNESDALHILNNPMVASDAARAIRHRLLEAESPKRADSLSGLIIGETGTRNVTLSASEIYACANEFDIPAIDTSVSGGFDIYVGATKDASAATQWPNTYYNASGVKTELTVGKYANLWWWVELDGNLVMAYGTDQYTSPALAQAEGVPATIPVRLSTFPHSLLVGRFIFQKSAATTALIESVFTTTFAGAGASNHNDQSGLQGGSAGEYYHATSAEYTILGNTSGTNTGDEVAASTTVAGVQENGTAAEIDSDTALKTMTPDAMALSKYAASLKSGVVVILGDGTNVIPTGPQKIYLPAPYSGTITGWMLLAGGSGSIVLDIWVDDYAAYPPTVADTITAAAKPSITTATKNESTTLTGWSTGLVSGNPTVADTSIIEINVDSTDLTRCIFFLKIDKTGV